MKTRLTALIAILAVATASAGEPPWRATLRHELDVEASSTTFCSIPFIATGRVHYTVAAEAAKCLESQPRTELLPFLSELRTASSPLAAGIVDAWTSIVRLGLHGKAAVMTSTATGLDNVVIRKPDVPVVVYSVSMFDSDDDQEKH